MANNSREEELRKDLEARLSALGGEQQERLARHRANVMGLPYMSLTVYPIDPEVIESIPLELAERSQAVLFYHQGNDVRIGAVNPKIEGVQDVVDAVVEKYALEPQIHVISHRSFKAALSRYRREEEYVAPPRGELQVSEEQVDKIEAAIADLAALGKHITQLSPTELLSTVVTGAVTVGASDVHIEPTENKARLRYRIDGVLQDVSEFARSGWRLLLSRVKVMSKLKLNIRDIPQDGSFVLRLKDKVYDLRVSTLPGGNGENIVLRILDRAAKAIPISDLGMKEQDEKIVMKELNKSNGMILMTGPTGSGKTTSLASFLASINSPEIKIITLEDPIEYRVPGVEQTQIDTEAGYTFAKGLRAILRQDPDVVMVGEIRDAETAATALNAAMTGHLVFSTLHTNNAPDAIPRLIDLGVKPFVIAPAINIIIAQRLVRRVCSSCAKKYKPDERLRERIREAMADVRSDHFDPAVLDDPKLTFQEAQECEKCVGGYKGRVGIFEVMPIDGKVEELVLAGSDGNQVREAALASGMTTILQDGYLKVIAGITTIEDVHRVTEG
ncbi:hypothetical protein CL628_02605 [bacterium]|nr:hypothetical protein [bacterium]